MTQVRTSRRTPASSSSDWSSALDTTLRVLLVIAAPVCAAIFIAHSF